MATFPFVTVASVALSVHVGAAHAQPTFQVLNPFPGFVSAPRFATPDGRVVVGDSGPPFSDPTRVWRWRAGLGFADLPGSLSSIDIASGSETADVIVGKQFTATGEVAARWTAAGGVQQLGFLPTGIYSNAEGVSGDGSVVVGSSDVMLGPVQFGDRAFRWTAATGMTPLFPLPNRGPQSVAHGISRDGLIVVGASGHNVNANTFQAVRWLTGGTPQSLGSVPGGLFSFALSSSSDGSVIAGNVQVLTNPPTSSRTHPFRWTESGGMVDLGLVPGALSAQTLAINGDGSAVVGVSGLPASSHAFLWTQALGMVDLNTYLPTLGIDLTNWTLAQAIGVSDDGRTIVGWGGLNSGPGSGIGMGWVVTIPSPAAAPICVLAGLTLGARRRR